MYESILLDYTLASRQEVNYVKSSVVFSSSTSDLNRLQILSILQMQQIEKHDKYMGLFSVVGQSRREAFTSLKDRVWQQIQGYEEKLLSQAGKEVLVKSVLQAISTYAMGYFR